MSVVRQSGFGEGTRQTSMGPRDNSAPVCNKCRERKQNQIYVRTPNGDFICEDCASHSDRLAIGTCDPESCACGQSEE
jgi:hypothetical protein